MSYLNAEEVLPKELLETIQQYVNGKAIYIPTVENKEWGSNTDTKRYLRSRNIRIYEDYINGLSVKLLAKKYSLSDKSIQRIIREVRQFPCG